MNAPTIVRRLQLREAATLAGVSVATLTRAIHTTDPESGSSDIRWGVMG